MIDMVMVRDTVTETDLELPVTELLAHDDRYLVLVWDEDRGGFIGIHRLDAVAGLFAYAATFTPGSWASWAAHERAMRLAGDDLPWQRRLSRGR